jgi:hypothetical protein
MWCDCARLSDCGWNVAVRKESEQQTLRQPDRTEPQTPGHLLAARPPAPTHLQFGDGVLELWD